MSSPTDNPVISHLPRQTAPSTDSVADRQLPQVSPTDNYRRSRQRRCLLVFSSSPSSLCHNEISPSPYTTPLPPSTPKSSSTDDIAAFSATSPVFAAVSAHRLFSCLHRLLRLPHGTRRLATFSATSSVFTAVAYRLRPPPSPSSFASPNLADLVGSLIFAS